MESDNYRRGRAILQTLDTETQDRLLALDLEGRRDAAEKLRKPLTLEPAATPKDHAMRRALSALADYLEALEGRGRPGAEGGNR